MKILSDSVARTKMNYHQNTELMSLEIPEIHFFEQKQKNLQMKTSVVRNISRIPFHRSHLLIVRKGSFPIRPRKMHFKFTVCSLSQVAQTIKIMLMIIFIKNELSF